MEQEENQNQEGSQELALSEQSVPEGGDSSEQAPEVNTEQVEEKVEAPKEETQKESPKEPTQAQKDLFDVNGEQVDLDTLKNGYLRQSDYTRKAQELATQREQVQQYVELESYLKQNPAKAQRVVQFLQGQEEALEREIDPQEQKVALLEQRLNQYIQHGSRREADTLIKDVVNDPEYNGIFQNKTMEDMLLATHMQKGRGSDLKVTAKEVHKEIVKMQAAIKLQAQDEIKKNRNSPTRKSVPSQDTRVPAKDIDTKNLSWAQIREMAIGN